MAGLLSESSSTLARLRLAKCATALRFKADPLVTPFPFSPLAAAPPPLAPPVTELALDPRAVPPPLAPLETPPPLAALEGPPILAPLESPPILAPLDPPLPLVPLAITPPRGPTAAPPPLGPLAAAAPPFPALAPPLDPRAPLVPGLPLGPLLRFPPLAEPLGDEDLLLIAPGWGCTVGCGIPVGWFTAKQRKEQHNVDRSGAMLALDRGRHTSPGKTKQRTMLTVCDDCTGMQWSGFDTGRAPPQSNRENQHTSVSESDNDEKEPRTSHSLQK